MDVIPSEMFRGHLDTIILLSLVDEDKHTNQIREEIEKRSDGQFELKQGTFYSCLQRIVKQGYVTEYRASTPEGRRKFLQLTEKGKNYIDDNKDKWAVSRSIVNTLFDTPEKEKKKVEVPKPVPQKQPDKSPDFDIDSALRDFLNSDDTSHKTEIKAEEKPVEPEKTISSNVTIIDFGDIASSKRQPDTKPVEEIKVEKSDDKTAQSKPRETVTKTVHQIGIDEYEYPNTPEGYEIDILVGDDVSSKQKQEKPAVDRVPSSTIETLQKSPDAPKKSEPILTEEAKPTKDRLVSHYPDPLTQPKPDFTPVYDESEDDSFGPETVITHDYKAVLESMFTKDKPKVEDAREIVYVQGTNIHDYFNDGDSQEKFNSQRQDEQKYNATQQQHLRVHDKSNPASNPAPTRKSTEPEKSEPQVSVVASDGYDFSDVQSLAKIEGFKVNISSKNTKNKVNSILINKLVTISAWIFYAFCVAQIALLAYFTAPSAGLTGTPYLIFASVLALFPLGTLLVYFLDPKKKVGTMPTLKSVIELCIVVMLNLVLITVVFSILAEVDFSNVSELLIYILYPTIIILNVPVYFIIKYLNLENQRFYA